jgi:outer membrane protein assembly factor BamB
MSAVLTRGGCILMLVTFWPLSGLVNADETRGSPQMPTVWKRRCAERIHTIAFAADGKTVIWGQNDRAVRFWEPRSEKDVRHEWGRFVALSPDGKTLVVVKEERKHYFLLDADTGNEIRRFKADEGLLLPQCGAAFSADGKVLALGQAKGIDLWDLTSDNKLTRVPGSWNYKLGFSPDGRWLAASFDLGLCLIDLSSSKLKVLSNMSRLAGSGIRASYYTPFVFSPDGKILISGMDEFTSALRRGNQVRIWDIATGREQPGWPIKEEDSLIAMSLSPDGKVLATSRKDGSVWLWEMATGAVRARLKHHERAVYALAFSPDGAYLASRGWDDNLVLCDVSGRAQAKAAWKDLSAEQSAFPAMGTLAAAPEPALPFLAKRLRELAPPDAKLLARLLKELDDDSFPVREEATRQLAAFGELAEEALRSARAREPSAEVCKRLDGLLERLKGAGSGQRLRVARAVEVLEHLHTAEARRALAELSRQAPCDFVRREAAAARARLTQRLVGPPEPD